MRRQSLQKKNIKSKKLTTATKKSRKEESKKTKKSARSKASEKKSQKKSQKKKKKKASQKKKKASQKKSSKKRKMASMKKLVLKVTRGHYLQDKESQKLHRYLGSRRFDRNGNGVIVGGYTLSLSQAELFFRRLGYDFVVHDSPHYRQGPDLSKPTGALPTKVPPTPPPMRPIPRAPPLMPTAHITSTGCEVKDVDALDRVSCQAASGGGLFARDKNRGCSILAEVKERRCKHTTK